MKKETVQQAKTIEAAVALGAEEFGVDVSEVTYEVLEEPKKGLFGIGAAPAKVRITYSRTETPDEIALAFIHTLIENMNLTAEASISDRDDGEKLINVSGEHAGILIGHHGDTLDALQYLVNLAANRSEDEEHSYTKITVDVENYRAKREDTLRQLAKRMAAKVLKYKKSITLEPMNPYERRIIHSEIQNIEGVSTNSIGAENNRRIVIYLTEKPSDFAAAERSADRAEKDRQSDKRTPRNRTGKGGRRQDSKPDAPRTPKPAKPQEVRAPKTEPAEKPAPQAEESNFEETGSYKKPYYMRPKNAPGTARPVQKPVKKASVESYFFDLENSTNGLRREKEEPSDIAKACGIYDDEPVSETPDTSSSSES